MVRKTVIAGSLLSSNLYIAWGQTDYFGFAANLNPLLHLWSLSDEDQFYIMLALIVGLGLIWISRENFILYFISASIVMMGFGLVTLALNSMHQGSTNILLTYYSPLPRLFELGAGI